MKLISLDQANENQFLEYLEKDKILHIFTLCDLKYNRNRTDILIALKDKEILGYSLEFDKRIVHTHGGVECIDKLLDHVDLDECTLAIECNHLDTVEKKFKPIGAIDPSSKGKITHHIVMNVTKETFRPMIQHSVKKLGDHDLEDVSKGMDQKYIRRIEKAVNRGLAFGAYENGVLISVAATPAILDDLALIRSVYTIPSYRGRGFATSACSSLVKELINLNKEAALWVARDNHPARKVYEKIGFKKTPHTILSFKGKRK